VLQRILALAQKEFIQIRRDRRTLFMMLALPLIWLLLFGYAFTFDVGEVPVAVVDQSGTAVGAAVADATATIASSPSTLPSSPQTPSSRRSSGARW